MDWHNYHPDGVRRLAARLIELCVAESPECPDVLAVAVRWATWCGVDPIVAAEGVADRIERGDVPELRAIDRDDYEKAARDAVNDWHYSDGKTCPMCGTPITNTARSCPHHRWYK